MIINQFQVGHLKVFCYILMCENTDEAVVIDPGGEFAKLYDFINENNLRLKYIINTHNHPDHTFENRKLKEITGASIVMHKDDQKLLDTEEVVRCFQRLDFPVSDTPSADLLVMHGDSILFGKQKITIIHTPGHSPGSVCLLVGKNLFTGDSLFVDGAGRIDLPGGDFNTLLDSLAKRVFPLPDETIIWPGHNYGDTTSSTICHEKKHNPYLGGEW
jgi:glyoxylase-like metal-dependent hydrolase (beta-lactamase superfamily II)